MEIKIGDEVGLKNSKTNQKGVVIDFLEENMCCYSPNGVKLNYLKGSPRVEWQNGTKEYYDKVELIII